MTYLSRDRVLHQNSDVSDYGLNAASRARKIATIRSFYNYLVNKAHLLDTNPCKDLDSPKIKKSLPKYLTLDESVQLLQSVDGQNRERDYCILTIFLNCGLRISELCGLDLQDIQDDALRVLGKGQQGAHRLLKRCLQGRAQELPRRPPPHLRPRPQCPLPLVAQRAHQPLERPRARQKAPERRGARRFRILLAQAAPHGGNAHAAKRRGRQSRAGGARA